MDPQVLLVASSVEGNITAWDFATGTQLTSYKGNASPVNGVCLLGRDYLIATQLSKGSVHIWAWHKDQVHQRSFAAEPLTAVATTSDGLYCAAGGTSGAIHLWEVSSGRLLRSWPAHYKAVTSLAFNDGGSMLVSGGEDTLVNAWLLAEVLDSSGGLQGAHALQLAGGSSLQPLHSWSDHTLPVTAVAVGAGDANAVVVSASLDCSVKVRSLGQGWLLLSVAFPVAIHSVALDPGEHAMYAGSATGTIFEVSLVGDHAEGSEEQAGDRGTVVPAVAAAAAAAGRSGRDGSAEGSGEGRWRALEGHTRPVTCLSFTGDAAYLVSGSEDQSARVWDLRSRQQVRLLPNPAKGAITALLVIDRPPFMQVGGSHAASSSSQGTSTKKGPKRPQPLAPFAKYSNAPGVLRPWEGGLVVIDGSACAPADADMAVVTPEMAPVSLAAWGQQPMPQQVELEGASRDGPTAAAVATGAGGTGLQGKDLAVLREENERLKQQLVRALQAAQQWGQVNVQLQQMCSEMLPDR